MTWQSDIWAGMVKEIKGSGQSDPEFEYIYAEWNVPAIVETPADPNAEVAIWVGIGGGGHLRGQPAGDKVIQIGTGAHYDSAHIPTYYAWWETYGMPDNRGANFLDEIKYRVEPGDENKSYCCLRHVSVW